MEYHDKMTVLRKKRVASISILIAMGILFIILYPTTLFTKETALIHQSIIAFMIGYCILIAIFEWMRPDFIITEELIVLSHLPVPYLINKKKFRFELRYEQLERAYVMSTSIILKIKGYKRGFEISDQILDDFQTAKPLIVNEITKRKIPVNPSRT